MVGGNGFLLPSSPFSIDMAPQFGYFVTDNLALGGRAFLSFTGDRNRSVLFGSLSPFVRYFLGQSPTRPFAEGGIGYQRTFTDYDNPIGGGRRRESFGNGHYRVGLGITRFLTDQVGLEAVLGYNGSTHSLESIGQGRLSLSFGFQIYLPAK